MNIVYVFFFFNQQGWGGCFVLPKRETKLQGSWHVSLLVFFDVHNFWK